jgi:rare lipoprotein A
MKLFSNFALAAALAVTLSSAALPTLAQDGGSAGRVISGTASWYGPGFHGRLTANGERYNMNELTAAHKSLKFGTKVRVTNNRNGKSVVVRINDRGPYVGKRVIDLSKSAAQEIGMINAGTADVTLEILA